MTDANRESFEEFRKSFSYGTRNNLDFKFLTSMSDADAADVFERILAGLSTAYDTGDIDPLIRAAVESQIAGYAPKPGTAPAHVYDDAPFSPTPKPANGSVIGLVTSSGHFVDGNDPEPFGIPEMSQAEAVDRIDQFLVEAPVLSAIPSHVPRDKLRVRHGGYNIASTLLDPNVCFPIDRLTDAVSDGRIAGVTDTVFSFPGATAQGRLRRELPAWLDRFSEEQADAFLLVPV
jgi:hypothetical protein